MKYNYLITNYIRELQSCIRNLEVFEVTMDMELLVNQHIKFV